jgi:hypothetical protein
VLFEPHHLPNFSGNNNTPSQAAHSFYSSAQGVLGRVLRLWTLPLLYESWVLILLASIVKRLNMLMPIDVDDTHFLLIADVVLDRFAILKFPDVVVYLLYLAVITRSIVAIYLSKYTHTFDVNVL